jgi:hypothetical protein
MCLPFETFAKRPLLPNYCVPDERDLSTGSNVILSFEFLILNEGKKPLLI